jgi:dephospho-CoA kinase
MLTEVLGASLGAPSFSADEENRRLLDHDPEVRSLISSHLGNACYQPDGRADRKAIFERISNAPGARDTLESILHPRIEALWRPLAERFKTDPKMFFLAEIPLLFEKRLQHCFDKTIVVGCSETVRRERLQRFRSLSAAETSAWLTMQISQDTKIAAADYLLWNDGNESQLRQQIQHFASRLLQP